MRSAKQPAIPPAALSVKPIGPLLSGAGPRQVHHLWRLFVALVALFGSLSLAAPSAQAVNLCEEDEEHEHGEEECKPIKDQTFGLPGSSCSESYAAEVNLENLPRVSTIGPGETLTYTLDGIPSGLTFDAEAGTLKGTLAADLKTATAVTHTLTYTATARNSEDQETGSDSVTFTIAIVDERPFLRALYANMGGANWTKKWPATIDSTTCLGEGGLGGDLPGVSFTVENLVVKGRAQSLPEDAKASGAQTGRVKEISLPDNNLKGAIPEAVTHLHGLAVLDLPRNQLSGTIPEGLDHVFALQYLDLSHNQLSGAIPEDMFDVHFLYDIDLSHNQLSGAIPVPEELHTQDEFGHAGHHDNLDLSHNQLRGAIPGGLICSILNRLKSVNLSHNQLSGNIPSCLGRVSNLTAIDLSHNQLRGAIPEELGGLSKLITLNLGGNQLSGAIPAGVDGENNPTGLAKLTKLQVLSLHKNQLSGAIPEELGELSELITLNLGGNQLSGAIPAGVDGENNPTGLAKLGKLITLNLGGNQLSGAIPTGRVSFTPTGLAALSLHLEHLALHGNNSLTGPTGGEDGWFYFHSGGALTFLCLPPQDLDVPTALNVLRCPTPDITSDPGDDDTYGRGDTITVTLTFNQAVTVTTTGGTPTLTLKIGDADREALYKSGSGTVTLTFSYSVQVGDVDTDGIVIAADSVRLNGGTISKAPSNVLPHPALPVQSGHKVAGPLPAPSILPLRAGTGTLTVSWAAWTGAGYVPASYEILYCRGDCSSTEEGSSQEVVVPAPARSTTLSNLAPGEYTVRLRVAVRKEGCTERGCDVTSSAWTEDVTATVTAGGGGGVVVGGGGGGGGGGSQPRDRHGNTPADATPVRLRATAPWASSTAGEINSRRDVDYFRLTAPHDGVLVVETTGATDTVGTVWQAGEELATATRGGTRRNFRLSVRVEAGAVVIAVKGNGGRTGAYRLLTHLVVGYLENPGPASFQSGVGVLSGWVCEADTVEMVIETESGTVTRHEASYGTERADTARSPDGRRLCGDRDNGFGLLFNWNRLGDGEHTVVALVDEIELGRATVTVTTLDGEFVEDVVGTCAVADFPTPGETVTLQWQQSSQNFVIAAGLAPTAPTRAGEPGVGYLEIPTVNSFQSGVGVISGWVCEAEAVEIEITPEDGAVQRHAASHGTERMDTAPHCGDTDNGFGLLFNWNRLGDGEHTVVALVDGAELGRAVVRVTTLGEEFAEDLAGTCEVADFPGPGQTVTLEWQQSSQNFVIVDRE